MNVLSAGAEKLKILLTGQWLVPATAPIQESSQDNQRARRWRGMATGPAPHEEKVPQQRAPLRTGLGDYIHRHCLQPKRGAQVSGQATITER